MEIEYPHLTSLYSERKAPSITVNNSSFSYEVFPLKGTSTRERFNLLLCTTIAIERFQRENNEEFQLVMEKGTHWYQSSGEHIHILSAINFVEYPHQKFHLSSQQFVTFYENSFCIVSRFISVRFIASFSFVLTSLSQFLLSIVLI